MTTPDANHPYLKAIALQQVAEDIARAQRTEAQIRAIVRDELSKDGAE